MKGKKFQKRLFLNKMTISHLGKKEEGRIKGGIEYTYYCTMVCSENPDCDTLSDCGVTVGKPYLCPSVAPYPGC